MLNGDCPKVQVKKDEENSDNRFAFSNLPDYIPLFSSSLDDRDTTWEEDESEELAEGEEVLDNQYFSQDFLYRFESDPEEKVIWSSIFHTV